MKITVSQLRKLIKEEISRKGSLVIVDVQPEYENKIGFDIGELLRLATNYSRVLVLWNGPELDMSSEANLRDYYFEKLDYDEEVFEELLSRAEFFDKGYGFFRGMMDHQCFSHDKIVKIVKYMIDSDIRDIQDLSQENVEEIGVSELLVDDLGDYGFYVPDLSAVLPSWSGSDMAGGQEDECMAEVEILSKAMGVSLNKLREFVY